MKLKTIFTLIIIIFLVFIIYCFNLDKKIYYVNISDLEFKKVTSYNELLSQRLEKDNRLEKYINNFTDKDYRVTDLIRDIETNKKIKIKEKEQTIQNALIKSDILTIKMGDNELNYKIDNSEINELFEYSDTLLSDLQQLFELLRKYSKENIYFIGYYNNHSDYYKEIYDYLNLKIEDMCDDYEITFIESEDLSVEASNQKIYKTIEKSIEK